MVQPGLNVAVLGGGPLGTLMAALLSRGGAHVTLVKRRAERSSERVRVVPEVRGPTFDVELTISDALPAGVDAIVVAVRAEQLDNGLLEELLSARAKAVVTLSPLLGAALESWRKRLPGLAVAMPVLAAEFTSTEREQLHYWQVPATVIERGPAEVWVQALVTHLRAGGLWVRWAADAAARTVANTVALFPLHVAVFRRPDLRGWVLDRELREELAAALARSLRLGRCLGKVEPGLTLLVWWLSSAPRITLGVRVATWAAPGICAFVERHFGAKLGRQHLVLAREIQRLAAANAVPEPLAEKWLVGLERVTS